MLLLPAHFAEAKKSGFTLIELSIVLVIIGLVLGGVLVGSDMIQAAEICATIGQIQKYEAAANAFKTKFNCIPGDCPNAVSLGLGTDTGVGGHNGDGDGIVIPLFTAPPAIAEFYNFWYHLYLAGLVDSQVNGYSQTGGSTLTDAGKLPPAKMGHGVYIGAATLNQSVGGFYDNGGNSMLLGGSVWATGLPCPHTCDGGLTAQKAYEFDSKIDDGLPETGSVRELRTGYLAVNATLGNVARGYHNRANAYDLLGQAFQNAEPRPGT